MRVADDVSDPMDPARGWRDLRLKAKDGSACAAGEQRFEFRGKAVDSAAGLRGLISIKCFRLRLLGEFRIFAEVVTVRTRGVSGGGADE